MFQDPTLLATYVVSVSLLLAVAMRHRKVPFQFWHPVVATIASAICEAFVTGIFKGFIAVVVLIVVLKIVSGQAVEELFLPVIFARLAAIPLLALVAY